jgi:hypothetical protein
MKLTQLSLKARQSKIAYYLVAKINRVGTAFLESKASRACLVASPLKTNLVHQFNLIETKPFFIIK